MCALVYGMNKASLTATSSDYVLGFSLGHSRSITMNLAFDTDYGGGIETTSGFNADRLPCQFRIHGGDATRADGTPLEDGVCGYLGFLGPRISRHPDIPDFDACLSGWAVLPPTDFEALWALLSVNPSPGRTGFELSPLEFVMPDGYRWDTEVNRHLEVRCLTLSFKLKA